ncbi:MAG: glycoside hydrolase family 2 [Prevotella sp.]|nr:glycoside hydrolase family 2 [Prevotella sp.]
MRLTLFFIICLLSFCHVAAQSVAGLFPLDGSGRVVYNFNEGWRFLLGDAEGAEAVDFDDRAWPVVCAPHTVQLVPAEASGGRNYQGPCWYRKHFIMPSDMKGKQVVVHFEGIMGKQQVYVNGQMVKEHLGGYLPINIDLSAFDVKAGDSCLIAVRADNSDDKNYPPGKKQSQLDFAYHGGMYRDVWLLGLSPVHITDPLERGEVAGGGVFLHYDNISEKSAEVFIDVEIKKTLPRLHPVGRGVVTSEVTATIKDAEGNVVKTLKQKLTLREGECKTARLNTTLKNPHLWSPESPYLYNVELKVTTPLPHREGQGEGLSDGGIIRMGIRKAEFRGKDGFWLNGKPYHQLVGGNRHQDFAYVGNALPNSQQWRDAFWLKEAGMDIIRAAHYPQDPSFMDACDELGLFVIVPTPGWQYWNKAPEWGEMVHQNTRDIIRRDRNHPCVLMWEPILNETRYPEDFALKALQITREEFPYPGRPVAAADLNSAGVKENYDVLYDWTDNVDKGNYDNVDKCIFTREWGEYVDDWYAHNAINRAARGWGEHAMLTAALSLADTYGMMYHGQRQFIGGCQWHPFDHQRGYHPDAYLGGIYDAFRQKKYAFEMFRSQIANSKSSNSKSSNSKLPHLFIAHELTQFSPNDVTIFSNCDSVRLTALNGWKTATLPVIHDPNGIPNAPVTFTGFWDFWKAREQSYTNRSWQNVKLVAEGIVGDSVVCRVEKMPSRRSTKLRLYADEMGRQLVADGSDFIVVVAEVTDDNGNVRRLARESITFTVEGEGSIIGDASIGANPRAVEWGSAPVLVRSTHKAGKITIIARPTYEGVHAPTADTLTIESISPLLPSCYTEKPTTLKSQPSTLNSQPSNLKSPTMSDAERRRSLEEVERQQQDFGIQ